MKKHLDKEDLEQRSKNSHRISSLMSMLANPTRTNLNRTHPPRPRNDVPLTRMDDDEPRVELARERIVKRRVTMEHINPDNLAEFNEEFQKVYLDRDMSKTEAEEELKTTKESDKDFTQKHEQDPHPDLNQCEIDSLKHVDPDAHVEEEAFCFCRRSNKPTVEEHRAAQPASGYPVRLPLGMKSLRKQDDPDVIKAYTDILGSLMQATEKPAPGTRLHP